MSHRTKQETTIDAMVGYDVEFHCPNVTQLVDDVKQHDVGECHDCHADDRGPVKLHIAGISLIEGTKVVGYMGNCIFFLFGQPLLKFILILGYIHSCPFM